MKETVDRIIKAPRQGEGTKERTLWEEVAFEVAGRYHELRDNFNKTKIGEIYQKLAQIAQKIETDSIEKW